MYCKQSNLFRGVSMDFIKNVINIAAREFSPAGHTLFEAGDPASHFYILIQGSVKLSASRTGGGEYVFSRLGDTFGWSSLIDRNTYTGSAVCLTPVHFLKIENHSFQNIVTNSPENGIVFFKQLAAGLGYHLLASFDATAAVSPPEVSPP